MLHPPTQLPTFRTPLSLTSASVLGRGAAAPWTPLSLFAGGEAGGWYDPSDLSLMWQDSAGTTPAVVDSPVGKINDKSGRGNHMLQATSSRRPLLRQSGALNYLEFDGLDDRMATASGIVLAATHDIFGAFMVTANVGTSATPFSYFNTSTDVAEVEMAVYTESAGVRRFRSRYPGLDSFSTGFNIGTPVSPKVLGQSKRAASDTRQFVNGVNAFTDATASTAFSTTTRGFRMGQQTNTGQYMTGNLYGLVIRDLNMDDTTRGKLETYLASKSGITL